MDHRLDPEAVVAQLSKQAGELFVKIAMLTVALDNAEAQVAALNDTVRSMV